MSDKRSSETTARNKEKRSRNMIAFNVKLDIISRYRNGESVNNISQSLSLAQSTVRSIIDNAEKIINCYESTGNGDMVQIAKSRDSLIENMEKLLYKWIMDQQSLGLSLSSMAIKEKARSIWHSLKESSCDDYSESSSSFKASSGWLDRFKKRMRLNITSEKKVSIKESTNDTKTFTSYFKQQIEEQGYSLKQVFNIDECLLFWKTLLCIPAENDNNDKAVLVLGGNAEGDCKLKPLLIYCSETPGAIEECSNIPVLLKPHSKAQITQTIFRDYIVSHVSPFIEHYCKENGLENKALLIIDNASGHPFDIEGAADNIKVIFLPSNLTSAVQPLEQGIFFQFHNNYELCSSRFLVSQSESLGQPLIDSLNNYDMTMACHNIFQAWCSITEEEMHSAWANVLLASKPEVSSFQGTSNEISKLTNNVSTNDSSNTDDNSNQEQLINLCIKEELNDKPPLTSLNEVFFLVDKAKDILRKIDPIVERSAFCCNVIDQALQCYRETPCNDQVTA